MNTYVNVRGKLEEIPYVEMRFRNSIVKYFEARTFYDAVERGKVCACGDCLDCRALEYHLESNI